MFEIRVVIAAFALSLCAPVYADVTTTDDMRSLDEQVQEIKADVLSIGAELGSLEEQLLFPSNTQLAIFVQLQDAKNMRLDSVELIIDGDAAAHYIYSFKELEALQLGGVQRLYMGNIARGDHTAEVLVIGKTVGGREFRQSQSFAFAKGVEPQMLGLTLAGADAGSMHLASW
jgi:hypothetical protein